MRMRRKGNVVLAGNLLDRIDGIEKARKIIEKIHRKKNGKQRYDYWLNVFGKSIVTVQEYFTYERTVCIALLVMSRLAHYKITVNPEKKKQKFEVYFPETEYILANWDFALHDPVIVVETVLEKIVENSISISNVIYDVLIDTDTVPELFLRKSLGEDIPDIDIIEHIKTAPIKDQKYIRLHRGPKKENRKS